MQGLGWEAGFPPGFEVSCLFRVNSRLVASGFRTPNFRGSHTCARGLLTVPCSCLPTLRPGRSVPKVPQAPSSAFLLPLHEPHLLGELAGWHPLPVSLQLSSCAFCHFGKFLHLCVDLFSAGFPDAGMSPRAGSVLCSFPAPLLRPVPMRPSLPAPRADGPGSSRRPCGPEPVRADQGAASPLG